MTEESRTVALHQAMTQPMSATDVQEQVQAIQQIMGSIMKPDVHFGVIPGTKKPTLYKAGAEALLSAFRICVEPEVEDLSTDDAVRYRVKAKGIHMLTHITVGYGIGECSTNEVKYKWERAGQKQFDETLVDRRKIKYGWKWGQQRGERIDTEELMVRTDPADKANTVLKMAKKRAQIDLCLTALAASDCFAQDLEDPDTLAEKPQPKAHPKAQTAAPQSVETDGKLTDSQVRILRAKCDDQGIREIDLALKFGADTLADLDGTKINDYLKWIQSVNAPE